MEVSDYLKKAAGPYNPQTRYGGPERIAQSKKYIIPMTSGKYIKVSLLELMLRKL